MKQPTYEQIKLLETLLVTEAYIETIKPKIQAIYNDVMGYMIPPKYLIDKRTGDKITDYNQLYRIEDNKHIPEFYAEVNKVLIEKGFKPNKEGCCYLLEWECVHRDLQRKFCEACAKTLPEIVLQGKTPKEFMDSLLHSMKLYKQFLDINIGYVIGFVNTKKLKASVRP